MKHRLAVSGCALAIALAALAFVGWGGGASVAARTAAGTTAGTAPAATPAEIVCLAPAGERFEKDWQAAFAAVAAGQTEVPVRNGRVDVVTATHAIEVDWLHKWHEGIGQALDYSLKTGKPPGLALIVRPDRSRHAVRDAARLADVRALAARHGIRLFLLYETDTCPLHSAAAVAAPRGSLLR
jgi:hypothetical protein